MPTALPLYTAAATRELDRRCIEEQGVPGIELMRRAGKAVFDCSTARWPERRHWAIFCGPGNNGGDGFVIGQLGLQQGLTIDLYCLADTTKIAGDAALAMQDFLAAGGQIRNFENLEVGCDLIVDALLGTGVCRSLQGPIAVAVESINAASAPVVAVDIPTGLDSDSGRILGNAIVAEMTVTFIGCKRGLFTGDAGDCVGDLHFEGLGVDAAVYRGVDESLEHSSHLMDLDTLLPLLQGRKANSHKRHFGHVLLCGGDYGFAGAIAMAAETAARAGAGLVSVATRPEHIGPVLARMPEIMAHGLNSIHDLQDLLDSAPSTVVCGPGLGRSAWAEQILQRCLDSECGLVLDADALNLLAAMPAAHAVLSDRAVITPHPGEAARLLGLSTAEIQADRFGAALALQGRYGGTVILKGAGSIVATAGVCFVCPYGNPGMASAGMGDVLSGLVGALLAQGLSGSEAAMLACCCHSFAADIAAESEGERGMAASDLIPHIRWLLNRQEVPSP